MMKSGIFGRLLCVVLTVLFLAGLCWANEDQVIKSVLDGRAAVKPFPNPSANLPGLTVEKAYDMQKKLVKALVQKGDAVSGFKGGLTSEAGQKRFGVNEALMGEIFKSGELGPNAMVNSKDFVRLFIEQEVGYVIGQKISKPVKDVASLKKMIKEVFPAVELPDLRFAEMKTVKGPDIIVDAVGSAKYIVGKKMPVDKVDVSKVVVTLKMDGNEVNQGKASDCLGDQWKAALWLVNAAVAKGWTLEPGQILITGAMGKMIPGKPGKYDGNWGPLGTLSWTVK
jgi:2-keto-4-pentenoate hydratase